MLCIASRKDSHIHWVEEQSLTRCILADVEADVRVWEPSPFVAAAVDATTPPPSSERNMDTGPHGTGTTGRAPLPNAPIMIVPLPNAPMMPTSSRPSLSEEDGGHAYPRGPRPSLASAPDAQDALGQAPRHQFTLAPARSESLSAEASISTPSVSVIRVPLQDLTPACLHLQSNSSPSAPAAVQAARGTGDHAGSAYESNERSRALLQAANNAENTVILVASVCL
jgi:hypothetical protein